MGAKVSAQLNEGLLGLSSPWRTVTLLWVPCHFPTLGEDAFMILRQQRAAKFPPSYSPHVTSSYQPGITDT